MREYSYGVFIGRFQPLHLGHQHIIDEALKRVETLVIVIGSAKQARTPVNPFTFSERMEMIRSIYKHETVTGRILFVEMEDFEDDSAWASKLYGRVNKSILTHLNKGGIQLHGIRDVKIALTGYGKDASSFYLNMFPYWDSIQIETQHGTINASDIRKTYLCTLPSIPRDWLAPTTTSFLQNWALTDFFRQMVAERIYYEEYSKLWGKGPFMCADALVRHKGKILLITRGQTPGRGLLALPGGFVNPNERVYDAGLREATEETGLVVYDANIDDFYDGHILADNPRRSLRGRVISMVFRFGIPDEVQINQVAGDDDAMKADWYDFADLKSEQFFEDHYQIIKKFTEGE